MTSEQPEAFQSVESPRQAGYGAFYPIKQLEEAWDKNPPETFELASQNFRQRAQALVSDKSAKSIKEAERLIFSNSKYRYFEVTDDLVGSLPKKIGNGWWRRAEEVVISGGTAQHARLLKHEGLSAEDWGRLENIAIQSFGDGPRFLGQTPRWLVGSVCLYGWQNIKNKEKLDEIIGNPTTPKSIIWASVGVKVATEPNLTSTELLALLKTQGKPEGKQVAQQQAGWMLASFVHHPNANTEIWKEVSYWNNSWGWRAMACHQKSRRDETIRLRLKRILGTGHMHYDTASVIKGWLAIDETDDNFWNAFQRLADLNVTDAVELLKRRAAEGDPLDPITISYIMTSPVTVAEPQLRRAAIGLVAKGIVKSPKI